MPTILKQALLALTVPDIKDLVSHLPGGNTVGRKEELIDQIVGVMLGGASQGAMFSADLKSVWNQLDATQQSAVAEALYHPLGEYSTPRFRAKYETVPRFSEPGIKSHSYSSARRSALGLFLVAPPGELRLVIPDDLRPILRTFVVPPPAVQLVTEVFDPEGEDLVIRATEREAIQEMAIVLRTVEQTAIAVSDKTA